MQNNDFGTRITSLYGSYRLHMLFLHLKQRLWHQNCKSLWVPALICCFLCIHNSVIMTRINSLYVSQTSPVVVCMQNSDFSTRIASLYRSQPLSVVFACKIATLGPEFQVSIGPSPHQCFFCIHNSDIMTRINSLY